MFSLSLRRLLLGLALCLGYTLPALAGAPGDGAIGQTTFVIGHVQARDNAGTARPLARGSEIFKGDVITTAADAVAQLRFVDDSRMVIRRSSEIAIDDYEFGAARESMVVRLAFGALRSITGLIGRNDKRNVQFRTEVATIGIRGTDFEAVHVPVGRDNLFGAGDKIDPGTYNKVYAGGTHLESKQGSLDLNINESGFIGLTQGIAKSPVRIDQLPPIILKVISETPQVGQAPAPAPASPASTAAAEARPGAGDARDSVKQEDASPSVLPAPAPEASPDVKTITTLPVLKNMEAIRVDDSRTLSTDTQPTLIAPTTTILKSDTASGDTLPQLDTTLSTTTKTLTPTTTTLSPTLSTPTLISPTTTAPATTTTTTTTTTTPISPTTTIKTLSPTTTTILKSTTLQAPLLQR